MSKYKWTPLTIEQIKELRNVIDNLPNVDNKLNDLTSCEECNISSISRVISSLQSTKTCNVTTKTPNDTLTMSVTPSGAPSGTTYTLSMWKDTSNNIIQQVTNWTGGTWTHTFPANTSGVITNSDIGTTHTFGAWASYVCSDGTTKYSDFPSCSISVVSPPCNLLSGCAIQCPSTAIQGQTVSFSVSWAGGQGGLTVYLYKDGATTPFQTSTVASGSTIATLSTTIDSTNWSVGNHTISAKVLDSCTPTNQSCSSSSCTINVSSSVSCALPIIALSIS